MAKARQQEVAQPVAGAILPLPEGGRLRTTYYGGGSMPSPMGGSLELIRVQFSPSGPGRVLFECMTSSLRYELSIPRATKAEKAGVQEALAAKGELACPRHRDLSRLDRVGRLLVCRKCGIAFGEAR